MLTLTDLMKMDRGVVVELPGGHAIRARVLTPAENAVLRGLLPMPGAGTGAGAGSSSGRGGGLEAGTHAAVEAWLGEFQAAQAALALGYTISGEPDDFRGHEGEAGGLDIGLGLEGLAAERAAERATTGEAAGIVKTSSKATAAAAHNRRWLESVRRGFMASVPEAAIVAVCEAIDGSIGGSIGGMVGSGAGSAAHGEAELLTAAEAAGAGKSGGG